MNGPVFVASVVDRSSWNSETSLVGHHSIVELVAFNPLVFLKDPDKELAGDNLCTLLALGSQSSISFWLTANSRPLFVMHDVCARDLLDLQWSKDGTKLWFCSSDGHVGVIELDLEEIPKKAASAEAVAAFHLSFGFARPTRARAVARVNTSSLSSQAPSGPQKTVIMANGKRRIQPSFVGGLQAVQQSFDGASQGSTPVFPTNPLPQAAISRPRAPLTNTPSFASLPSEKGSATRQSVFADANAAPAASNSTSAAESRGNAVAPSPRKQTMLRNVQYDEEPLYASSSRSRDQIPPVLDTDFSLKPRFPRHPKGQTLGGGRDKEKGKGVDVTETELAPAFILDGGHPDQLRLAVPPIMTYAQVTMNQVTHSEAIENIAVERLEWRNFKDGLHRPSEIALIMPSEGPSGGQERTLWVDYLEHKVVSGTWNGAFGAISTVDGSLTVYSPSGRR